MLLLFKNAGFGIPPAFGDKIKVFFSAALVYSFMYKFFFLNIPPSCCFGGSDILFCACC